MSDTPWPRSRDDRRTGARRGRAVPGAPADRLRQSRRLPDAGRHHPADDQRHAKNTASVYRTPLIEIEHQGRLHQHHAGRRLSRQRPAGSQLLCRARDRCGRGRDGHRSGRSCDGAIMSGRRICPTPPPSGHAPMTAATSRRSSTTRCELADWYGFASAQGGERGARQRCAAAASASSSKSPACPTTRWAASASRRTAPSPSSPARMDNGQGHPSAFAQVIVSTLAIPYRQDQPAAGRQRPADRRRRERRLAIADGERPAPRARRAPRSSRKAARPRLTSSRRRRATSTSSPARFVVAGTDPAVGLLELAERDRGGCKTAARPAATLDVGACVSRRHVDLPERLSRRRGRDRPGDRHRQRRALYIGRRLRHDRQPDDRRGPGPWRRRAGHRPGPARAHRL